MVDSKLPTTLIDQVTFHAHILDMNVKESYSLEEALYFFLTIANRNYKTIF